MLAQIGLRVGPIEWNKFAIQAAVMYCIQLLYHTVFLFSVPTAVIPCCHACDVAIARRCTVK